MEFDRRGFGVFGSRDPVNLSAKTSNVAKQGFDYTIKSALSTDNSLVWDDSEDWRLREEICTIK